MAAFFTDRLLSPPTVASGAEIFPTARRIRRRSIELSETFTTLLDVICEWLFLLWMLGVVAFSLLIAAGAAGLLR